MLLGGSRGGCARGMGRATLLEQRRRLYEGCQVVAGAERAGIDGPQLALGFHDVGHMLAGALVERRKVVAHVHRGVGVGRRAVLRRARRVLLRGSHGAGEQLVDAFRIAGERVERHIADHGDVNHHAHGLGPQVVDVGDVGDVVLGSVFRAYARHVVGRDLGVDERVAARGALEMIAQVLRRHVVAADALQVQVARIARLVDEHHVVRKALIAGLRGVALGLFPVLERRGDQVHVEALLDEHLGQDAETRVAARLVAELDAHGDHGDAAALARLSALCVGLRIHVSKYTKPAPCRARRTANPHEPRRIRALMGASRQTPSLCVA